ncbi:hypothetical protein [Texcoconibacillus texcoconensis]|uniref:Chromosome segregation ATPase n=1 Tax=Texcoconibacillus texcoconensis TaxID=1095777 RepID=A0A840QIT7_9BACI|nr:hypothetical protein [Texcoconibacillus texcoconensis]MBB5171878.1 chromosome segregation ATPase [Texcoconibacillus texcoconensis]
MSEDRLNSLESHMQQLLQMMAENNKMAVQNQKMTVENQEMAVENQKMVKENNKIVTDLATRMEHMEHVFQEEQQTNKELLKELRSHQVDIDYLRNQVSKHDMKINKLKTSLQS